MSEVIIALSKGRILDDTLPLLADAGIWPEEDVRKSRKLIFATNKENIRLVVLRATDVPTYVQYGAADLGVSGKDVLLENGADNLCEPLDLEIAKCRLMTAGVVGRQVTAQTSRGDEICEYCEALLRRSRDSGRYHQALWWDGTCTLDGIGR